MNTFVFWLVEKSVEIALSKIIEKLLSDANVKQVKNFLKLQILLLYLDWVLLKTPLEPQKLVQLDEPLGNRFHSTLAIASHFSWSDLSDRSP